MAPDGGRLLVQRNSAKGNQLVWVHITGGAREEGILISDTLQVMMGVANLSPNAVGKDGRIAVRVISSGSWYAPAALLDPRTGRFEVLKPAFEADADMPGWGTDGSIVSMGTRTQSSLWRFRPIRE